MGNGAEIFMKKLILKLKLKKMSEKVGKRQQFNDSRNVFLLHGKVSNKKVAQNKAKEIHVLIS